jgi:hypothetical protein
MADTFPLRLVTRRLKQAIAAYVQNSQGIPPDDYAVVGAYDERTGQIRLIVGTDHKIDDRAWHREILQKIREAFPEYPQIAMDVTLVIRKVSNIAEIYAEPGPCEGEIDLTDRLSPT